ncbi:MAG: hypothetical protein H0W64_11170 [Gammaproteobacteria bacterium]|nr:hypothetical protein [Gammaproteobacteria bacterium]
MRADLQKKLVALGLISDEKTNTVDVYSWQNTHASRLDVPRFIHQQPHWRTTQPSGATNYKKIILNSYYFLPPMHQGDWNLLSFLYNEGFEVYVRLAPGEFAQIKKEDAKAVNFKPCLNYDLQNELLSQGEDIKQYVIIDELKRQNLWNELKHFIILISYNGSSAPDQLTLQREGYGCELNLSDENINTILQISEKFNTILCRTARYHFTWVNHFSEEDLKELLETVRDKKDNAGLLAEKFATNLKSLRVNDYYPTVVDVSLFKNLEQLSLDMPKLKEIIGLDVLQNLNELVIDCDSLKNLDLSQLKNLTKLTINGCANEELDNIFQACTQLKSLSIRSCNFLKELNLSKFNHLKDLTLEHCHSLSKITGFENLSQLENLKIVGDTSQINFTPLKSLKNAYIDWDCGLAKEHVTKGIDNCINLEELTFSKSGLTGISISTTVTFIAKNLTKLKKLKCKNINMTVMDLNDCTDLQSLTIDSAPLLPHLKLEKNCQLQELIVKDCEKLTAIEGLQNCSELQNVQLENCGNLQKSEGLNSSHLASDASSDYDSTSLWNELSYYHFNYTHPTHSDLELPITICEPETMEDNIGESSNSSSMPLSGSSVHNNVKKINIPSKNLGLDADTYTSPTKENRTLQIFENLSHPGVDPSTAAYRARIYDQFEVSDDDVISLKPGDAFKDLRPVDLPKDKKPMGDIYHGITTTRLKPNESLVLNGLSSQDQLIDISESEKLNLSYCDNTDQFVISIKPGQHLASIYLHYLITKDKEYEQSKILHAVDDDHCPKLPPKLHQAILKFINRNLYLPIVQKLIKAKTKEDRLNIIINYCRNEFANKELDDNKNNKISGLIEVIKEGRGSCRHRSAAAMALCHYFKIPARINKNSCHEFIEVPIINNNKTVWHGIDVGGSATKLKVEKNNFLNKALIPGNLAIPKKATDLPKEKGNGEHLKFNEKVWLGDHNSSSKEPNKPTIEEAMPLHDYHAYFWDNNAWVNGVHNFDEFSDKIINHEKPTLLRTKQKNDAWHWHTAFYDYLRKNHQQSTYIDNPDELKSLFETIKIENGEETTIDGPLKKMITQGSGTNIVNWTKFDPTQRVIYKSMMDQPPTLHGQSIASNIHLVGLLPESIEANDVFVSRSDEVNIPNQITTPNASSFPKREWLSEESFLDKNIKPVNLYHSSDWAKFLVEDLSIDGDQLISKSGPLVAAMKEGKPIIIQNAPFNDESFCRFWHQLTTEDKILVNGEEITYQPGFKVYLENNSFQPQPATVVMDTEINATGKRYYISPETFNYLFEIQYVDQDKRIRSNQKTWLQEYENGDQFILTSDLSQDQWQRIYDTLTELDIKKATRFHFYQSPQNNIENTEIIESLNQWIKQANLKKENALVETNDIHFTTKILQTELQLANENIFYISDENLWANFIENITLFRLNKKIRAEDTCLPLLNKLIKGETVILCGELTKNEFSAIQTLFYTPPFLFINGERRLITGKLIVVSPPNLLINDVRKYKFNAQLADYTQQLKTEVKDINTALLDKVETFLAMSSTLETKNAKYPDPNTYGYEKIKSIYDYCLTPTESENPIKSILTYHYRHDSEHYAFLNVLAKLIFSKSNETFVRVEKLKTLLAQVKSEQDFDRYFWRIVNCLSPTILLSCFSSSADLNGKTSDGVPKVTEAVKKKISAIVQFSPDASPALFKPHHHNRYDKQLNRLMKALENRNNKIILLLGDSGTGKTYTAKLVAKQLGIPLCVGEDSIKRWLSHPEEGNLLLLDEVNFAKLGKWEFLRGLEKGLVYYDHEYYPITTQQVIGTGNSLHYSLRNFHPVLWDKAHVIWFAPFQCEFIQTQIKKYLQAANPLALPNEANEMDLIYKLIIQSYLYLQSSKQHAAEITLRDIENICTRITLLQKYTMGLSWRDHTLQAIYDEMSGIFLNVAAQKEFKNYLVSLGGSWQEPIPHQLPQDKNVIIPPAKYHIWRLIENDLQLRQLRINKKTNFLGKLGPLIEGPSGIGKSTLYMTALEQAGLRRDATDTQMKYIQITAGSLNDEKELLEAFHGGSAVILDELNANPKLETLLNQLLTGVDLKNQPATKPGFTVFASQNPPQYDGCKVSSRAIVNRLHKITMDNYTFNDFEYIAKAAGHPEPTQFTKDYFDEHKKHPSLNARNFFYGLKRCLKDLQNDLLSHDAMEIETMVMQRSEMSASLLQDNREAKQLKI